MRPVPRATSRRVFVCLAVLAMAGASVTAVAALPGQLDKSSLPLPTQQQGQAQVPNLESLLNPHHAIETRLPGPVSDREHVSAGLASDGKLASITAVQRLVVHGLGDFSFKVPGPAQDVFQLPSSENPPGLRKGSVIWEGFSDGTKHLGARMPLFPDKEAARLPVNFQITATIDGRPLSATHAQSGPLDLSITITNQSVQPVTIERASAKPEVVAGILDRVRADLERRSVPRPGAGGIPKAVPVTAAGPSSQEQIEAPFQIRGKLLFQSGEATISHVRGGDVTAATGGPVVDFEALLGGGSPLSTTVHVTGTAHDMTRPTLSIAGRPAVPDADSIAPPSKATWRAAARAGDASGRAMVVKLFETMWRVARLRQYDAYVGNPDPSGPARTSYSFAFAAPRQEVSSSGPALKRGSLTLTITGLLALALLLFDAAYLWALS